MNTILKENEMDRAQLILAAKSVLDDLQDMAEKLAKMEADGVMPLLDGIRLQFGPEFAERFNNDATAALRTSLEGLKTTKDQISKNISNMEQMVTGEGPGNDMATGAGLPAEPAAEVPDQVADVDAQAPSEAEPQEPDDIDDVFGTGDTPVGRETKESVQHRNIKALRESTDPDRLVMTQVLTKLRAGKNTKLAVMETAKSFGIDVEDVLDIVREQTKK
jgi:hypothetical protein